MVFAVGRLIVMAELKMEGNMFVREIVGAIGFGLIALSCWSFKPILAQIQL